jgi:hypothetical protein
MSFADALYRWNRRWDDAPEGALARLGVCTLLGVGAINMMMTIETGFPFGLLVIGAIALMLAIRMPFALGWLTPPPVPVVQPHSVREPVTIESVTMEPVTIVPERVDAVAEPEPAGDPVKVRATKPRAKRKPKAAKPDVDAAQV